MAAVEVRMLGLDGDSASLALPDAAAAPADLGLPIVTAGQTETAAGVILGDVSLDAGGVLTEAAGGSLAIFGQIDGPASGSATIEVAAGSTLYAAGAIGPTVMADFEGQGGSLELAALYLPHFSGAIAGFSSGDVLDIISGTLTDAALTASGNGEELTLSDEGAVIGSLILADSAAAAGSVFAVPDAIDGTRILLGPSMPTVSASVAAGTLLGSTFAWSGGESGAWNDAGNWVGPGGGEAAAAPGARDSVAIDGSSTSMLVVAGNAAAESLSTQGLVALSGSFDTETVIAGVTPLDALVLTTGCYVTTATGTLDAGVLQVAAADSVLDVSVGTTLQGGILWVADGGQAETPLLALEGAAVRIGAAGTVCVGSSTGLGGQVSIGPGGVFSGFGSVYAPVGNDGTVQAAGGVLAFYGALSGDGASEIESGGELYTPYGAAAGGQIAFSAGEGAGGGTLELFGTAANCAATITGFGIGDVIDIASDTLTQAIWTPGNAGFAGMLDLGAAGTLELSLAPGMDAATADFAYAPDGIGGSAITLVPCFCAGTRLAAPCGEIAVEDVAVGDRLLTFSGAARRVVWIGWQDHGADVIRDEPQLRPVRILAGALGKGLPRRDLCLSPQHALALNTTLGLRLAPSIALVDGCSIRREPAAASVRYFHIELESHDLLMAEGIAAESFLGGKPERRSLFQQSAGQPASNTSGCFPRLDHGQALIDLRAKLGLANLAAESNAAEVQGRIDCVELGRGRVRIDGWAIYPDEPNCPVWVDIFLDGIACAHICANRWRPDLDRAGLGYGSCAFAAEVAHCASLPDTLPGLYASARPRANSRRGIYLLDASPG